MSKQLHQKILQLRNKVGASPILYAHRSTKLEIPFEKRAQTKSDYDSGILKQYFAIFGVPDDYGTVPVKGCFSKSLQERGVDSKGSFKIPALYMHSQGDSVGLPTVLKEDEVGLYGEVPIMKGVQVAEELAVRHANEVCNNGSYGFNYVWDKMEYDDKNDVVLMKECDLFEVSFVTIGSQKETFGLRGKNGEYTDEFLSDETEDFLKRAVPRVHQLELRQLIDRHITLAKSQPLEQRTTSTVIETSRSKSGLDFDFIINNLKIS